MKSKCSEEGEDDDELIADLLNRWDGGRENTVESIYYAAFNRVIE